MVRVKENYVRDVFKHIDQVTAGQHRHTNIYVWPLNGMYSRAIIGGSYYGSCMYCYKNVIGTLPLFSFCLFVCFCFVTGHAPRLPCPRGRSCTIDTPWQTHSSFKEKVKADIISPLFTISSESHPSVNQQFSSLCYSELLDNINFYLSQL